MPAVSARKYIIVPPTKSGVRPDPKMACIASVASRTKSPAE